MLFRPLGRDTDCRAEQPEKTPSASSVRAEESLAELREALSANALAPTEVTVLGREMLFSALPAKARSPMVASFPFPESLSSVRALPSKARARIVNFYCSC